MANIKIKRGSGVPSGLTFGELAFDTTNKKLYIGLTAGAELLTSPQGGVSSVNGATGAITNVAKTNVDNIFSASQTISTANAVLTIVDSSSVNEVSFQGEFNRLYFYNDLSGGEVFFQPTIAPASTITVSLPDYSTTLAGLAGTQTFTNTNTFNARTNFPGGISASGGTFSTQLNAQNFKALTVGGDEGGQIDFGLPVTNSSLTGGVAIDIWQNKVRIFETGGTNRGVFIDLTGVSASVGTNLVGGGGGGAVSSVSGSGNGILVSPTTGSVIVQNTGVHSFNGLTGAVTGVTTTVANTFTALQSFNSGISASGGTFNGQVTFSSNIKTPITYTDNLFAYAGSNVYINDGGASRTYIGDTSENNNATWIVVDDNGGVINLNTQSGQPWTWTNSGGEITINAANLNLGASTELRFYDANASNYVELKSPAVVSPVDVSFTLPATYASVNNQVLSGTTLGVLSWASSVSTVNGFSGGVTFAAGSGITFTASSNTITLSTTGGGGITRSITTITGSTNAGNSALTDYVYNGNTTGNITLTMPTAVSNTNRYTIKNSNIGVLSIYTTSSQTIDGVTFMQLGKQYQAVDLLSDNSNWFIV